MKPNLKFVALVLGAVLSALPSFASLAQTISAPKVLRYAIRVAETGFDPAQVTDLYSNTIAQGIFEAPLEWEFMARPARMRLATASAMPEVSSDFKTFTFHIKPGIYFADDAAFGGKKRELVALDYVYAIKRHYDPRWKSGKLYVFEQAKVLGLSEVRNKAIKSKKPFDYDLEVEGLKALSRYSFQVKLAESDPRFVQNFCDGAFTGAMAREVVEKYDDKIMQHPVGTGPWVLSNWKRSSLITLTKNPNYREVLYDEHPPDDRPDLVVIAAKLKGRRLPMLDRVEVSVIEESQPRWLSFLSTEAELVEQVPNEFVNQALPHNHLAHNLAKRGMKMVRYPRADVMVSFFNMEDPVVGGYTPEKIALRRAIGLAVDLDREIHLVRRGQAIAAQSIVGPQTFGYDPKFKSEMSEFSREKSKALLDLYGYADRDGDGWRELPDGSPLKLTYYSQPDLEYRQLAEQWQINMDAIGVKIEFKIAKWPENLKASRAGKLQMWGVGWSASTPDSTNFLVMGYGPHKGQANHARFDLPAYNAIFDQQRVLPDGLQRQAAIEEAKKLLIAYMPYKVHVHRIYTDITQSWVLGYDRNVFIREFWRYLDIDPGLKN
mgnify:CR=1 FL=1